MSLDCQVYSLEQTLFLVISDFSIDLLNDFPPILGLMLTYKEFHIIGYSC
jgi:hypothetical protein